MNIDFRKLSKSDQIKAVTNVIELYDSKFLMYLMRNERFDVYGWFNIDESNEGFDYWYDIKIEQRTQCN